MTANSTRGDESIAEAVHTFSNHSSVPEWQLTLSPRSGFYFLELGDVGSRIEAGVSARKLSNLGFTTRMETRPGDGHRVILEGYFENLEEASKAYYLVRERTDCELEIKRIS